METTKRLRVRKALLAVLLLTAMSMTAQTEHVINFLIDNGDASNWRVSTDGGTTLLELPATVEMGQTVTVKYIGTQPGIAIKVEFGDSHEDVDLGLPSALRWSKTNLGAYSPEEYGHYIAWGEKFPRNNSYDESNYLLSNETGLTKYNTDASKGTVDNQTTILPEDDAATFNWGSGWRIPTKEEWEELCNNTTSTWTTQWGVYGYLFTSSNGNSLFLPAAGYKSDNAINYEGQQGFYWSATLYEPSFAWHYKFNYDTNGCNNQNRWLGMSIRPVRRPDQKDCSLPFTAGDEPNTWTFLMPDDEVQLTQTSAPYEGKILKITSGKNVGVVGKSAPDFTQDGYDCYFVDKDATVTLAYTGRLFVHLDLGTGGPTLSAVDGQPLQRSFTMPAQDVTIGVVEDDFSMPDNQIFYTGSAFVPAFYFNGSYLSIDTDFTLAWSQNGSAVDAAINAGSYNCNVTCIGAMIGQWINAYFTIDPKSVTPTVTVSGTYTFTGADLSPTYTVKDGTNDVDTNSYIFTWQKKNANGSYDDVDEVLHSGVYRAKVSNKDGGNYTISADTYSNDFTVSPATVDNVSYVDVEGGELKTKTANGVTVLEGNETMLTAGTYVALKKLGDIALSLRQYSGIAISGDVTIILGSSTAMQVTNTNGWAIYGSGSDGSPTANDNLTIYPEQGTRGGLILNGSVGNIYVHNLNLVGGLVTNYNDNEWAYRTTGDFTMRNGYVTGTVKSDGNVSILGGNFYVFNNPAGIQCGEGKTITLGWLNASSDRILSTAYTGTVKTVDGQRFMATDYDGTNNTPVCLVSGTVADNSALADLYLFPYEGHVVSIPADANLAVINEGVTATTVGENVCYDVPADETVTLSYTGTGFITLGGLPDGTSLSAVDGQPMQRTFTMPAEDVTLTVSTPAISVEDIGLIYNGRGQLAKFSFDDVQKTVGTDFTVAVAQGSNTLDEAVNAGQYEATLTGLGQYIGTRGQLGFTILPKEVRPTVTVSGTYTFTNQELSPTLEVKDEDDVIDASEYTVSWQMKDDDGNYYDISSVLHSGVYRPVLTDIANGNYTVINGANNPDVTVSPATVNNVLYVDVVDGQFQFTNAASAIVLEGHETKLTSGTYYAQVNFGGELLDLSKYKRIEIDGDVSIILGDGSVMTVNNPDGYCIIGTNDDGNYNWTDGLKIYGQIDQNGMLRLNGLQGGIYVGQLDIYGGQVTGTDGNNGAFNTDGDMTQYFGLLTGSINGSGNVSILGGQCAIYNDNQFVRCGTGKTITLGWISATNDYIRVNRFDGTVQTAVGKYFTANDYVNHSYVPTSIIGGTVTDNSTINGKTLLPVTSFAVTVGAKQYATFYGGIPLTLPDTETEAALYTVSDVSGSTATLTVVSAAPAETPLLVYNGSDTEREIILTICYAPASAPTVYDGFKGTLTDKDFTDADMESAEYYVCTGHQFVRVLGAGTIAAHRCWLQLPKGSSARSLNIVVDEATGITTTDCTNGTNDDYYDLNGRKLDTAPTRKGIYIRDGRKVIVK